MQLGKTVLSVVVAMALPTAATAMDVPVLIAPTDTDGIAVVRDACPTFHWSAVNAARAYDLALFRVGSDGVTADELYRIRLPRGAQGWTPTVERCLEAGGRYAWALRALGPAGEAGPWSEARVFRVASRPTAMQVEEALTVLRHWVEDQQSGAQPASPQPEDTTTPLSEVPGDPTADPTGDQASAAELLGQLLRDVTPRTQVGPRPQSPAPVVGPASLTLADQLHLGKDSNLFKEGDPLLWDDSAASITALGRNALRANTTGINNTATGSLTLAQNADGSNNTATGSLALRLNAGGSDNTATGHKALWKNVSGARNTAAGVESMRDNTIGSFNTASGWFALEKNDSGAFNTAMGAQSLQENLGGISNTAVGYSALRDNTTGWNNTGVGLRALRTNVAGLSNVAVGIDALFSSSGNRNTAVGPFAGFNSVAGSDNIFIGSGSLGAVSDSNTIRIGGTVVGPNPGQQNRTFINGIAGVNVSGAEVVVTPNGQLGVKVSSARYKQNVRDMGDTSTRLLALRPVTFNYKDEGTEGPKPVEFGLIAEEVAEIFPELVVWDAQGRPQTVKYHLLSSLLLNELQELGQTVRALEAEISELREREQPGAEPGSDALRHGPASGLR